VISVLQLKEIDAGYGRIKVLDKLNLNIPENKIYCLLGPNGSGKTTTFRIISNILMPWSGIIEMEDIILNKDNNYHSKSYKGYISYLPEGSRLYPSLTVEQNLRFWSKVYGTDETKISEVMEFLSINDLCSKKTAVLSHGQLKRVDLARALLKDSKILILDEPFSGLDPEAVKNVRKIIKELSSYSYIIISTHVLLIADQIADTVGIIYHGKVMLEDSVEKIKKKLKIGTIKIMAEGNVDYALSPLNYDYEHKEGYYYVKVDDFDKETPIIVNALTKENCKVKEVKISNNILEEIYLELTRGD